MVMIKIYHESVCKPLQMIFKSCIENDIPSNEWKKANVLIYKKGDKQELKSTNLLRYFRFI